jgi:glycosyltransferase involved in cell wall biosynthesis
MKNKNILFIARNYPPNVGGMENLNYELANELKKIYDLHLIYNSGHRYSITFLIKTFYKSIFAKEKLVLLSDPLLSFYIPILKMQGKTVLVKVNGLDIVGQNFIYQLIIPRLTRMANKVLCISNATKNECIKRGVITSNIVVIPPGIYENKYYSPLMNNKKLNNILNNKLATQNNKVILTIGRLIKRKGQYWFIKNIFPLLPQNIIYIIAGDGPEIIKIKKYINKHNLENRIYILGRISEHVKKILLNTCDLFIMPNIPIIGDIEGFGIAALEASSCGKPLIASDLEGIKDVIKNGVNGYLIEPENRKAYLNMINQLFFHNKLKTDAKKIRKYISDNFSWNEIIQKYKTVFDNFI